LVISTSFSKMSAALRLQNKRKTARVLSLEESAPKNLGTSSPKSVAKKTRKRLRSPTPNLEDSTSGLSETSSLKTDTLPATSQEPVEVLDPTASALDGLPKPSESPPAIPAVLPVSAFTETVVATNPVASNTLLVEPVVNNNPLSLTPSHGRFLHPTEKIERLSKKPTRAQVVQITTNLKRDNCRYLPIDVVLPENYLSFETLQMKHYVTNPFKMAECAQWRTWDRDRFCPELLSAVPDIAVVRPESAANFVEQMAQVVIRCDLADPSVEETVDNGIQLIVHRFPDATPEQHLRAVKILISRLPEQPINWRIILTRTQSLAFG
jgi:hypothetical protein